MLALRRQLLPAIGMVIAFTLICCVGYPALTWAIGDVAFHHKITGSFVKDHGVVVGSSLIGQNFLDASGNPLPQYFQPRPSDSLTSSYNPAGASSASNLGPSNPLLIGFVPGVNAVDLAGNPSTTNPFATPADPYCVPMTAATKSTPSAPDDSPAAGQAYARNNDGSYQCDPNTIPERAIAYRQLNGLAAGATVPADAVTASASGLDPDISLANADLQAARVAGARHLPLATVLKEVAEHTAGRQLGFLGERTVNVLELNIALDNLSS